MTALWLLLRSIAPRTWLVSGAVVLAVAAGAGAYHWHTSAVDTARREVRDSIASAARTVQPAQKETVYIASRRTTLSLTDNGSLIVSWDGQASYRVFTSYLDIGYDLISIYNQSGASPSGYNGRVVVLAECGYGTYP